MAAFRQLSAMRAWRPVCKDRELDRGGRRCFGGRRRDRPPACQSRPSAAIRRWDGSSPAGGTRLHYVEHGRGQPVVFLHGNGAMVEDLLISGIIDRPARRIAPLPSTGRGSVTATGRAGRNWTAGAQASILPEAFRLLGIERPIVVGHSWGTLVALALALDHPRHVSGLVLASGYYYPNAAQGRGSVLRARNPRGRRSAQSHRGAPDRRGDGAAAHRAHVFAARGFAAICRAVSRSRSQCGHLRSGPSRKTPRT